MILELGAGGYSIIQPPKPGSRLANELEAEQMYDGGSVVELGSGCSAYVPDSRVMPDKVGMLSNIETDKAFTTVLNNLGHLTNEGLKSLHDAINREIVSRWTR